MNHKNIFRQVCQRAMVMTRHAAVQDMDFDGQPYGDPTCSYRSEHGPCLIGSLITDQAYHEDVEHNGVQEEVVIQALKDSNVHILDHHDVDFLAEIQDAHDGVDHKLKGYAFQKELRENLKIVAKKYKVPFPKFYKAISVS
jgi:hypothetical protein